MSAFERETAVREVADGEWATTLSTDWHIGDSANGGYAMSPVLRAMQPAGAHTDPISVTTHFLRPVQDGGEAIVRTRVVRAGRTVTVATGTLQQAGSDRLVVSAVFADVESSDPATISLVAPDLPSPEACAPRDGGVQGVDLPISSRVEVRVPPSRSIGGESDEAVMEGWIRFADGTAPSTMSLPLFADAFPPSLFTKLGRVGWVPTIELTVHVRARPAEGWVQARLECDDLAGGRMIETGTLWDSTGRVVARSRQLGLLLEG